MFTIRKQPVAIFLSAFILAVACNPVTPLRKVQYSGEAQGTYYVVTYFDENGRDLQHETDSLLDAFNLSVSLWEPRSVLIAVNTNQPEATADEIFTRIFELSKKIHAETEGAFDPTVGPLVNAWGFGFSGKRKMDSLLVDSLKALVGLEKVTLEQGKVIKDNPGIRLDFNAIAQGYSVDLIGMFLESKGIHNYLIDVGGEVLARGTKPDNSEWTVGIEKPSDDPLSGRTLMAKTALKNKAMATSGNYRKFYVEEEKKFSHTIDPGTGYPVQHSLLSATIVAGDCATADAWATACMVLGWEKANALLEKNTNLAAYFIYADNEGKIKTSFTQNFSELIIEEY